MDDFFGDDGASKINNDSAQVGQLRNEYNASSRGVSTLTQQREEMETTANSTAAEVEELKEKLKASRETYEREQKLVQDLSIKAGDQKKELQEARQELIRAESELSGLKVERAEAEGSLMRDKEEIRMLKGKLAEINQQTNEIRVALVSSYCYTLREYMLTRVSGKVQERWSPAERHASHQQEAGCYCRG